VIGDQFNERSEAFAVTTRIFQRFVAEVREDGHQPLIVVFPTRGDLLALRRGLPEVYRPLTRFFDREGLPFVDLMEAFVACGAGCPVDAVAPPATLHYSHLGNRIVGEYLAAALRDRDLVRGGRPGPAPALR
jgi:hypothetical protein